MHRHDSSWPDHFYGFGGPSRAHGEMIADADEHHVNFVKPSHQRHVGKQVGVAGVVKGRPVAQGNDQPSRLASIDGRSVAFPQHCRAMPRRHKGYGHFPVEQS